MLDVSSGMIDPASRDRLATALRQYVAGRITNDDLDECEVDWRDTGAVAVNGRAWRLYDDTYQHRAVGKHHLPKPERREMARWIIFLHSDREYTWPHYSFVQITNPVMNLLTLGSWERRKQTRFEEFMAAGDFSAWPFITRPDFQAALERPKYFAKEDGYSDCQ